MNPVRLLLVEDDAVSRGFLRSALQTMPATLVDAAVDAKQALRLVREHRHDLWLLDANLPDADGESLLSQLRRSHAKAPALCLTADDDPERHARLLASGFAEVLRKPLEVADLHRAVGKALTAVQPAPVADLAIFDDASALCAMGGMADAVRAMRALFVAELPAQAATILAAIDRGDVATARQVLHKLKASCGFVGSLRLHQAAQALSAAPTQPDQIERFRVQVAAIVSSPTTGSDQSDA